MNKFPQAGKVKTRLAAGIGEVMALSFYRNNLKNTLRSLGAPSNKWDFWLAVTPDAKANKQAWANYIPPTHPLKYVSQGEGDLGERINHLFTNLPNGPVIIIGSDIPEISPDLIHQAFTLLETKEVVIGPGDDGGYWLLGMKRLLNSKVVPLHDVRWSTEYALADTLSCLKDCDIGYIDTLPDIDTKSDYQAWKKR